MPKFNQVAIAIAGVVRCLNLISYQLLQKLLAAVLFRDAFFKTFLTQEAICKMTLGSYFSIKNWKHQAGCEKTSDSKMFKKRTSDYLTTRVQEDSQSHVMSCEYTD